MTSKILAAVGKRLETAAKANVKLARAYVASLGLSIEPSPVENHSGRISFVITDQVNSLEPLIQKITAVLKSKPQRMNVGPPGNQSDFYIWKIGSQRYVQLNSQRAVGKVISISDYN